MADRGQWVLVHSASPVVNATGDRSQRQCLPAASAYSLARARLELAVALVAEAAALRVLLTRGRSVAVVAFVGHDICAHSPCEHTGLYLPRAAERPWGLGSSLVIPSLLDFAGPQPRLFPPPQGGFPSAHVSLAWGLSSRRCAQGALCGAVSRRCDKRVHRSTIPERAWHPARTLPRERRAHTRSSFGGLAHTARFPSQARPCGCGRTAAL